MRIVQIEFKYVGGQDLILPAKYHQYSCSKCQAAWESEPQNGTLSCPCRRSINGRCLKCGYRRVWVCWFGQRIDAVTPQRSSAR